MARVEKGELPQVGQWSIPEDRCGNSGFLAGSDRHGNSRRVGNSGSGSGAPECAFCRTCSPAKQNTLSRHTIVQNPRLPWDRALRRRR